MSEFDATIGGLPNAPLPALGTDFAIVSRNGVHLNQIPLRNWPLSNPVAAAIATRLGPTDLATINGQSLFQPGGNIVIATGGTATWGSITGTLSAQSDLQGALNGKQPVGSYAATNVTQSWVAQGQLIGTIANGGVTISSGTITLNLGAFNAFDLGTLAAGAYTLANPTGLSAGVSYKGDIKLTTPASGTVTFAYGSAWDFDSGTALSIPTANSAVVFFDFSSHNATNVRLSGAKVWS